MADVQKQFEKFHDTIRVDYDMAGTLQEKRDIVVKKLKKWMKDNGKPTCEVLLQGSYKMKTGVIPIADLEFDIDIGLRFAIHENDYPAATVRGWVLAAVDDHTMSVEEMGPCIRVNYSKGFHLDLVSYAVWEEYGKDVYRLAHKTNGWRKADPPGLLDYVNNYRENFKDTGDGATQTDQFRRCVRCLRRWNDERMPYESDNKPAGLAYVLLSIQRGLYKHVFSDGRPDDRAALTALTRTLAQTYGRLQAKKPTPEYEDILARLDEKSMTSLKTDLGKLADALDAAGRETDVVQACKMLRKEFGDDFPIPPAEAKNLTEAVAMARGSAEPPQTRVGFGR
ncbi:MAG: nucleotidyltransferase [Gemmataceae bacterium]